MKVQDKIDMRHILEVNESVEAVYCVGKPTSPSTIQKRFIIRSFTSGDVRFVVQVDDQIIYETRSLISAVNYYNRA